MDKTENIVIASPGKINIHPAWLITIYHFFNLVAFSIHGRDVAVIRFAREPVLILLLLYLFWSGNSDSRPTGKGLKIMILLFFLFGMYAVFNSIFSLSPLDSFQYYTWFFAAILFFWKIIWSPPSYVSLKTILVETSKKLFMLHIFIIAFSYAGGYLLGQEEYFDLRYNENTGDFKYEFGGIFSSTNAFGILLYQTFCLGLIVLTSQGFKKFPGYFAGTIAVALLIYQVNNRSSLLCLVAVVLLVLVFYYKNYVSAIGLTVGLIGFALAAPDFLQDKLRLNQFEGARKFGNRTELIEQGISIADEMNFFGVGYYNQRKARRAFGVIDSADSDLNLHNTYLAMLIEFGYFGILVFLGTILLILGKGISDVQLPENKPIAMLIFCFLIVMMVFHSTVEDSYNSPGSATFNFFWFLLLMLLAISDEQEESLSAS
jgi:O-antigen ligase